MPIATVKTYLFTCDWLDCRRVPDQYRAERIAEAIRQAEAAGWLVTNGQAWCPTHAGAKARR